MDTHVNYWFMASWIYLGFLIFRKAILNLYVFNLVQIKLLTPHYCYKSLGKTKQLRQESYLSLFDAHIPDYTLEEINESVMKGWSLGSLKFIKKIEKQTGQWSKRKPRGSDRKSKKYKDGYKNT